MKLVCPECKNDVNLTLYPSLAPEHVIECDQCGITLQIQDMSSDNIVVEIVDEGK
jgi:hypothetical protein